MATMLNLAHRSKLGICSMSPQLPAIPSPIHSGIRMGASTPNITVQSRGHTRAPSHRLVWLRNVILGITCLYVTVSLGVRWAFPSHDPWASAGVHHHQQLLAWGRGLSSANRPVEFDQCGHWQEDYIELHRKILAGKAPGRYLVAVQWDSGLADQLLSVVTAFYWAVITTGHQRLPPLTAAFDAPFIDWTRPLDPPELTERLYRAFREGENVTDAERAYPEDGSVDTAKHAAVFLVNNSTQNRLLLRETDLRTVFADHPVLFTTNNRGRSFRLFDNPHHRRALQDMGLRPETAFGCAFQFLFQPNAAVMATETMQLARRYETEGSKQEHGDKDVLRIGIQIRTGDWSFEEEHGQDPEQKGDGPKKVGKNGANKTLRQLQDYMPFFTCAKEIEAFAKPRPDMRVLWYLISDSQRVRQAALEWFGPGKVVTLTKAVHHVSSSVEDVRDQRRALVETVADILLLARTDFKVLTQLSGLGKVATLMRSNQWHSIYWPDEPYGNRKDRLAHGEARKNLRVVRTCTADNYVRLEEMADSWSGL